MKYNEEENNRKAASCMGISRSDDAAVQYCLRSRNRGFCIGPERRYIGPLGSGERSDKSRRRRKGYFGGQAEYEKIQS